MAKKLEVRHLTISFRTTNGAVRAVRDVSFDLNEGETLAIAGESGSGKSVTTRAVMGILAGNAMVENGEIIYDGRDLLKIPEEEFHTLRGHKLSMVFQDPLSALNPIMRIGKQLTEAMLLNNKERRADGKKRFNQMLSELEKNMTAAGIDNAGEQCREFNTWILAGVKMENAWQTAKESAVGLLDSLEEADLALLKKDEKEAKEICARIGHGAENVRNMWLIPESDAAFTEMVQRIVGIGKGFEMSREVELREAMDALRNRLNQAVEEQEEVPDFFALAYYTLHGGQADPQREPVRSLNAKAGKALSDGFMDSFLTATEKALAFSDGEARKTRKNAVEVLKKELPVFQEEHLQASACKAAARRAGDAVENAIDRMALDKDNRAYVFRSSLNAYIERYFYGLKHNPREQARFDRETVRYQKETAKGKFVPSVVPLNLVDLERVRGNMCNTVQGMIDHFEENDKAGQDFSVPARKMVDYLKERASEYAYHLSKTMAKHRAIELMKEVGIPKTIF